jgi:phosphatidate phosphatase APP1
MKTAPLLLLFLAGPALAGPDLLLFPAVGSSKRVTVYGRTLARAQSKSSFSLKRNLKNLLNENAEGVPVEVSFLGQTARVTSGHDGNFEATFDSPDGGFPVGQQPLEARCAPAISKTATVEVASDHAPFLVISDFDDTVAVTNVLDKKGLLKAALVEDETTQPVVPGMSPFYGCLREVKPERPVFALVSGSPVQFEPRIRGFLSRHGFGPFGIYLRDLGPTTLSDYKQPVIRRLLQSMPHQVVLVGDSGEHDPEVYRQIRAEFPGRVLATYIRNAGRADDAARFKDMVLFNDPAVAARDAATKGFAERACVEKAFAKTP